MDTVQAQRRDKPGAQEIERVRRKRQRLNVIPGKSIGTRNSSGEEDSEQEEEIVMVEEEDDGDEGLEDEVEYITPSENLLRPETFVLVKFASGQRRCTIFKYVCKILTQFSVNEFNVVGYKSSNLEKTKFKQVESDLSTVPNSDIIVILPTPTELDDKEYEFSAKVDVKEL
ncbi:hypothetical protein NQ314_003068 [Rhamnusium bicolor]|uniref:Uncharacterized protein n=1 Tax=Rhamnusium bicolor TaxID=1586634 RepID=A0AAV8ZP91_9CUCU|nr:hypothetical protein NQ314_003068 [Rhamnusium bicolor]